MGFFRGVLQRLERAGVPAAIAGAFAMQHYTGLGRATKDLDLFLPGEWVRRALRQGRTRGLSTEVRDPVWLAKIWQGRYYVDLISGMSNGALWVTADWIAAAHPLEVPGVHSRLLAPEEMILSKLFVTRRDRFDGGDICHLLYRVPEFDWRRLLAGAGEHGPVLLWHLLLFRYVYPAAAAERVPGWVWRRLIRQTAAVPPQAPFRGSLIDDLQFRIDVRRWGLPNLQAELRRRRLQALSQEAA